MPADLAPTIALGVGSALLAFEGLAALRSLVEIHTFGDRDAARRRARHRDPVALTTRSAIRGHFAARRHVVAGMRRQYPTLGSARRGRELRAEIRRVGRHPQYWRLLAPPQPGRGAPLLDDERRFELRVRLAQAYSLITPTRNRITTTMTITPTIPTPPLL